MSRRPKPRSMRFVGSCVSWPADDVDAPGGLVSMIDEGREITRRTFLAYADPESLSRVERELGYAGHYRQGLTMAGDYHVRYFRSHLHGKPCVYFVHSAIEFVFVAE